MKNYRRDVMRRHRVDIDKINKESERRQKRGSRMTILGVVAAVAFLAYTRVSNPGMPVFSAVMIISGVALACVILIAIGGRSRK